MKIESEFCKINIKFLTLKKDNFFNLIFKNFY